MKTVVVAIVTGGCMWGAFAGERIAAAAGAQDISIQLWDAQKTNWSDAKLKDLKNQGFTVVQNGYGDSYIPARSFHCGPSHRAVCCT